MHSSPVAGRRRPVLLLCSALLGLGVIAWAFPQDAPHRAPGIVTAGADAQPTLGDHMSMLGDNLKALSERANTLPAFADSRFKRD